MYTIIIRVLSLISKNERNTILANIYKIIDNSDRHILPTYLNGGDLSVFFVCLSFFRLFPPLQIIGTGLHDHFVNSSRNTRYAIDKFSICINGSLERLYVFITTLE